MLSAILTALALFLVIEGLLPFISPDSYKKAVSQLTQMPSRNLQMFGLGSMVAGAFLLYLVRHFG